MKNLIIDYWKSRPREFAAACGDAAPMKRIEPVEGDYIILSSDDWRIFEGGKWRQMTEEEQIEASL